MELGTSWHNMCHHHAAQGVWCFGGEPWALATPFLLEWGARWAPLLRAEPQRWLTPMLLHRTFSHLLSNMLLFGALCLQLEIKYGVVRIALLWVLSSLGGATAPVCSRLAGCTVVHRRPV